MSKKEQRRRLLISVLAGVMVLVLLLPLVLGALEVLL